MSSSAAYRADHHLQSKSAQPLFHSTDAELGKRYIGAEGGLRTWLMEGKVAVRPGYLGVEVRILIIVLSMSLHLASIVMSDANQHGE
jgi:hypothetical protein